MEGSGTGTIGPTRTPRERATPTCTMEAKDQREHRKRGEEESVEHARRRDHAIGGLLALVPTKPAKVNVHADTAQRHMIQVRPRN